MKRIKTFVVFLGFLGMLGILSSENAAAIEAYFDSQISTDLEAKTNTGTLLIRMIDEEIPSILPDVTYEQAIYVEIIFDASKTMGEPDINGIRKIDIAKKLASILVTYFPPRDTRFALRVNGGTSGNNCLDTELVIPFCRENGQEVLDTLREIQPTGLSPLAYSLRQLLQDFEGIRGTKLVFLITDGQETCDVEPVDTCTVTMDLLVDAEFEGNINVLGVNTIYEDTRKLLSCFATRGNGEFLDSNRNNGRQFVQLIRNSSQLGYNISRVIDIETLAEGKILGLLNRSIGDVTELVLSEAALGGGTDVLIEPGIIRKERQETEIQEIEVTNLPRSTQGYSRHELPAGVYKIEFLTIPPLVTYVTVDQQQGTTVGVVRSGLGLDLYDRAHLALGNRYYDNGQFEEAIAEYQKVLEFDSKNVNAHLNLGIIYQDILNDNEKAAEHYKTYLELQGPRQEEVAAWLRKARGLPSEEEELEQKRREVEEARAQEEAARQAEQEAERQAQERRKAVATYNEIRTANPEIVQLDQEAVISGNDPLRGVVSLATPDSKAQEVALDIGGRMMSLLNQSPEIMIVRENKPDIPIARARYDATQLRYVLIKE